MVVYKLMGSIELIWDHDIYPSYSEYQDEGNSSPRMVAYPQRTEIAIYRDQFPNVAPNTMLWQRLLSAAKSQTKLSLSSSLSAQFHTPDYLNHLLIPLYPFYGNDSQNLPSSSRSSLWTSEPHTFSQCSFCLRIIICFSYSDAFFGQLERVVGIAVIGEVVLIQGDHIQVRARPRGR